MNISYIDYLAQMPNNLVKIKVTYAANSTEKRQKNCTFLSKRRAKKVIKVWRVREGEKMHR